MKTQLALVLLVSATLPAADERENWDVTRLKTELSSLTIEAETPCPKNVISSGWEDLEDEIIDLHGGKYSPYDGTCYPSSVYTEIEHIVARKESDVSGMCNRSTKERERFTRDLLNLTVSPGALNASKGSRDPGEIRAGKSSIFRDSLSPTGRCFWAAQTIRVKRKHNLTVDRDEYDALNYYIDQCEQNEISVARPVAPAACKYAIRDSFVQEVLASPIAEMIPTCSSVPPTTESWRAAVTYARDITCMLGTGTRTPGRSSAGPNPPEPEAESSSTGILPRIAEIQLGDTGSKLTLFYRDGDGWTLNGESFSSGADIKAENGATYTIHHDTATDTWTAVFKPAEYVVEADDGREFQFLSMEGGGFTYNGSRISNGDVLNVSGVAYRVALSGDGHVLIFADGGDTVGTVVVPLGGSDRTLTLLYKRDGTFTSLDGAVVESGETVKRHDKLGAIFYRLTLIGRQWTATRLGTIFTIEIGVNGRSVELIRSADDVFKIGGHVIDISGILSKGDFGYSSEFVGPDGMTYRLRTQGGFWHASHVKKPVYVQMGDSGRLEIVQQYDESWRVGGARVRSGFRYKMPDGKVYRLTLGADNVWTASLIP